MAINKKLIENIASLYVLQGANYLLPLVVLPYLVRILGPDRFGLIAFAQAFMQYFIVLMDYGFNLSATKKIAASREQPQEIAKISSNVFAIKSVLLVLSFLVLVGIVLGVPKFRADSWVYLSSFIIVVGNALFPLWYFQGIEQMRSITIINVIGRGIATVGIFVFVKHETDYVLAAFIQALGFGITGGIGLYIMLTRSKLDLRVPTWGQLKQELKDGWHVFLSTAAISMYTASNTFLLGLLTNNTAVGYFSAAEKVIRALQGIISPVSQSIYPYINSLYAKSQHQAKLFIRKITGYLGAFSLFISLMVLVFAPLVIRLLFGPEFRPAIEVLRWMAPVPFVVTMSNVFGLQTMLTFGLSKELSRIFIVCGFLNLAVIIPMIYLYGANGAAFTVSVIEFIVTGLMVLVLAKRKLFFHFQRLTHESA